MVPAQTPLRQTGATPRRRLVCIEMVHGAAGQHPLRRRSKLLEPPEIRREFRFVLLAGVAPCLSGVPDHRQQPGCPPAAEAQAPRKVYDYSVRKAKRKFRMKVRAGMGLALQGGHK